MIIMIINHMIDPIKQEKSFTNIQVYQWKLSGSSSI